MFYELTAKKFNQQPTNPIYKKIKKVLRAFRERKNALAIFAIFKLFGPGPRSDVEICHSLQRSEFGAYMNRRVYISKKRCTTQEHQKLQFTATHQNWPQKQLIKIILTRSAVHTRRTIANPSINSPTFCYVCANILLMFKSVNAYSLPSCSINKATRFFEEKRPLEMRSTIVVFLINLNSPANTFYVYTFSHILTKVPSTKLNAIIWKRGRFVR